MRKRAFIKDELGLKEDQKIIAFYHPYTNACGGGEKVLFLALQAIAKIVKETKSFVIVYTGRLYDLNISNSLKFYS